ncbi:MAG: hypothetical protein A2176_10565 [Spirochaetes bacterium RBG_13_51_14]|nr:MAG: hypothetical protein A2176_10565 [Spirochaetes bacterium RBG_13_51_14]
MTKKIVIAAAILGLSILVYFLCGGSDTDTESKNTILMDATVGTGGDDAGPEHDDELNNNDRGDEGTAAREELGTAPENAAAFALNRDSTIFTYRASGSFRKISASPEMTGYVVHFAGNMSGINVNDQSTINNVISFLLPPDVTPGTYSENTSPFMFQFFGTESGMMYTLDPACSFTLTIDEWGGPGGRARGTFSGDLKSEQTSAVITIRDGRFDVGIQ